VSELIKTFRIAIGKEDGDKEREGDNRTPEGIYFTASPIDGKTLPQKYGPLAIPIDFPNPIDKFSRKTGYGIWLHGVEKDTRVDQAKVTEGCVAFYNSDIESLTSWLRPDQAVVVIAHDARAVNRDEDTKAVEMRTREWADAWKARNLERYMSFYSPEFVNADKNLKAWHEYKRAVFGTYKEMKIEFDTVRVITHPKYALSVMNQDFRGDNRFVSIGRKMLYWMRGSDGNWYITREVFENRKIKPMRFTEAEIANLSSRRSSASISSGSSSSPNL
jgi:murein L,D-transpeptidase YafK